MRGIQITEYVKGAEELKVSNVPDPVPKPNEYLIRIHATACNFFDLLQIKGIYQHQPPLPWISGSEFSGVIINAPTSLSGGRKPKYKKGDKVFGAAQGGYATLICAAEEKLQPVPEGWSFFDAAGLFVTMPTSYAGLVVRCGLKAGDWVLVHAAAGGVGLAAVQIAKALGASVIATAGTKHKLDIARSFGADYAVNYKEKDWFDQVKNITPNKRGVDIVYDPVGLVDRSLKCIAWNGRILVVGFVGGELEKIGTNRVMLKNVAVIGLHWGPYSTFEPETIPVVWDGIYKLVAEGKIRGTCFTDEEFVGLERVPAALKALGERETWGKVVISLPQEGASKL